MYFTSIRSQNYEKLSQIFDEINHFEKTINLWSKDASPFTSYFMNLAKPILTKVERIFSRLIRYDSGNEALVVFLKDAAKRLNRLIWRCTDYSAIADKAQEIYNKIISLIPENFQLELFGNEDFRDSQSNYEHPLHIKQWARTISWEFLNSPKSKGDINQTHQQLSLFEN